METTGIDQIYYLYIMIGVILGAIALIVAAKKGLTALMKGNYMTNETIEETLLKKTDLEHECYVRRADCTKAICNEIRELKIDHGKTQTQVNGLKSQVDRNLQDVKGKINGVGTEVKELRASMETELRSIARFMGSVDTFMRKNNKGAPT